MINDLKAQLARCESWLLEEPDDREVIEKATQLRARIESLEKSDICVFQKGWTRSEQCVTDYKNAWLYKIKRYDSHFYTEKCSIKL